MIGDASKNHSATHRTRLFKQSGTYQPPVAHITSSPVAQSQSAYAPPHSNPQTAPVQTNTASISRWEPFFNVVDQKPAESYIARMDGFWSALDPHRTGNLTLEALSGFYDALGIPDDQNTCTSFSSWAWACLFRFSSFATTPTMTERGYLAFCRETSLPSCLWKQQTR